jgi:hypothetical protein
MVLRGDWNGGSAESRPQVRDRMFLYHCWVPHP